MAKSNPDVKNAIQFFNVDERVAKAPLRIEVSIQMHMFYKMIVDGLNLHEEEGTGRFLEGIKLYVFLGGMFESWANHYLRRYLEGHRGAPPEMFEAVEKKQLQDKLRVIGKRLDVPWWRDGVKFIGEVSEMRNRLMHFKDLPTVVPSNATFDLPRGSKVAWADIHYALRLSTPNPKIYNELVDQNLVGVRDRASDLYGKLCKLVPPLPEG